jgi:hypothetical protein
LLLIHWYSIKHLGLTLVALTQVSLTPQYNKPTNTTYTSQPDSRPHAPHNNQGTWSRCLLLLSISSNQASPLSEHPNASFCEFTSHASLPVAGLNLGDVSSHDICFSGAVRASPSTCRYIPRKRSHFHPASSSLEFLDGKRSILLIPALESFLLRTFTAS